MSDQPSNDDGKKKRQQGAKGLQRIPLKKSLELTAAVLALGEGIDPVSKTLVLDKLGRNANTGPSNMLIASSNTYGLTKSVGERLEITQRGKTILTSSDSLDRYKAIYDALFSNEIFSILITRYSEKPLPVDDVILDYLKQNHSLSESDAKTFWEVAKTNILDYGLSQDLSSGKKMIISREKAESTIQPKIETKSPPSQNSKETVSDEGQSNLNFPQLQSIPTASIPIGIAPEFHFNIQIHLPSGATPDQYDAIFKSIATHLLGRKGN